MLWLQNTKIMIFRSIARSLKLYDFWSYIHIKYIHIKLHKWAFSVFTLLLSLFLLLFVFLFDYSLSLKFFNFQILISIIFWSSRYSKLTNSRSTSLFYTLYMCDDICFWNFRFSLNFFLFLNNTILSFSKKKNVFISSFFIAS